MCTESVSVSIAKAVDLLIFEIHFFRSLSDKTVSYFASFFGASCLSLFAAANSSSANSLSSSSSLGLNLSKSSKLNPKSTSSFNETNSTFLSNSLRLFLRLSPTTPFIASAFFFIPSKSPYSISHLAAVFCPTFGTPGMLSDVSPTKANISRI